MEDDESQEQQSEGTQERGNLEACASQVGLAQKAEAELLESRGWRWVVYHPSLPGGGCRQHAVRAQSPQVPARLVPPAQPCSRHKQIEVERSALFVREQVEKHREGGSTEER
jgi:hypothetical protein